MKELLCLLAGLALVVAAAGCRKEDIPIDACGTPARAGYRVFIHSELNPDVPAQSTPEPQLFTFDNQFQPSAGFELITSLQRQGNVLRLCYCRIIEKGGADISSPARSVVSLLNLPAQVYQLDISVRNRHTTGTLDLTALPARLTIADTTVAMVR